MVTYNLLDSETGETETFWFCLWSPEPPTGKTIILKLHKGYSLSWNEDEVLGVKTDNGEANVLLPTH